MFKDLDVFLINIAFQIWILLDELPEIENVETNKSDITDCFETTLIFISLMQQVQVGN